ncbi:MAG: hypothetical protein R3D57_18345 [Hyphomicrobiaceae bacterium]
MPSWLRKALSLITALATAASIDLQPLAIAQASETSTSCQVDDESAFRAEIDKLTAETLRSSLDGVDYQAVVNDEWRKLYMDEFLDRRVAAAVDEIKEESGYLDLLKTLTSKEATQKLTTTVAERVYRSEEMKAAIERLVTEVGKTLATRIELGALDAKLPAVACVRAYLGPRYGSSISLMVSEDTGTAFEITPATGAAEVGNADIALSTKGIIAGTVVLIVRRTLSNMARRVGQRVVGAVLGRLVSVVATGVGLVLIAKDIWDMRHGVMPIIETEMKSEETKSSVREELASAISEQLGQHLTEVSAATADHIVALWHDFRQAHTKVVELAERFPSFKAYLDSVGRESLPRVDRVVALILAKEREAGVVRRLEDGTLDEAVKRLPEPALIIANDLQSLQTALDWRALAGNDLERVVSLELHRLTDPTKLTRSGLERILSLGDTIVIRRIAAQPAAARAQLLSLPADRLKVLATSLGTDEMTSLAGYLEGLSPQARPRLLEAVSADPGRMQIFAKPHVATAIKGSRDQARAVEMVLGSPAILDWPTIKSDVMEVVKGEVHPLLLWETHRVAAVLAAFGLVLVLLVLRRLLAVPRRAAS